MPEAAWRPAYNIDGQAREGAWVAEITDAVDLSRRPAGSRLIVRRERPHPGAQLRFTDADGHRFTAFLTDTSRAEVGGGDLAALETRHRAHAQVEDRIRAGKDTGMANLPCIRAQANAAWLELALCAADLLSWIQLLCLDGELARCEPKRLRYRLLIPPAGWSTQPGRSSCACPATGRGLPSWPRPSPGSAPLPGRPDSAALIHDDRGPGEPVPTRESGHWRAPIAPGRRMKVIGAADGRSTKIMKYGGTSARSLLGWVGAIYIGRADRYTAL